MAIEVKWEGQLVGRISNGELTAGTRSFQAIWRRFRQKGIARLAPPDPVPLEENVLADGVEVSFELEAFLVECERTGFTVEGEN